MPRPYWSGQLRLALVSCGITLTSATTEVEKIKLNRIQRGTETRLRQQMINPETGKPVPPDEIVMGYQFEKDRFLEIDKEELDALKIESSEVIAIERVVPDTAVDWLYWDMPYLVAPDGKNSDDVFAVIREALKTKSVVGLGRMAIARRERPVLLRPSGKGMLLATLRDPDEVRNPAEIFDDIRDVKVDKQNLSLAQTLIERMRSDFDLSMFEDRYQEALKQLIDAKLKGQKPKGKQAPAAPGKYNDLLTALKASIADEGTGKVTMLRTKGKQAAKSAVKPQGSSRRKRA
jgi:DNA end-binding protein Ku